MIKKAVALGNFDGMHIGHTAVLNSTYELAQDGFLPCALLFTQHSEKAIFGSAPPMLMTDTERKNFILSRGLHIESLDFQSIRELSPEEFVDKILIGQLNAGAVVCGYNYRFGKNAVGNADTLKALCVQRGMVCRIIEEISVDGIAVSSTAIREYIENGEIKKAERMLGRKFGFTATVIHGDARGRGWGFPTINQLLPDGLVIPKFGVYASVVSIDGVKFKGVTNIGRRPTIGTDVLLSETHIIDFGNDIYGKQVDIRLVDFIRSECKFSSFNELVKQINSDCETVKGCEFFDV